MTTEYPIHDLIEAQRKRLEMRKSELSRRCGFKNISKGIHRIDSVCRGDLRSSSAAMVLDALPAAFEIERDVVAVAVQETERFIAQAEQKAATERERLWRASFKPSAYLLGTERRPSQICFYGMTGGPDRHLKIALDTSQASETFAAQALAVVKKTPVVQFFGPTTGFIVNYTPDHAIRFDVHGIAVESFGHACSPGQVEVQIGKTRIPSAGLWGSYGEGTGKT